jgi:hypothetical protein
VKLSQQAYSSVEELRQIQFQTERSQSVDELRQYFDRVQELRRKHLDDFDLQLFIADVHEQIVERARSLREQGTTDDRNAQASVPLPPHVERLDQKTWQRAAFIGLFFAVLILAAFFYLIQAARKSNLLLPESVDATAANPGTKPKVSPVGNVAPAPPAKPMLRLYTDLVPGTVSIDAGPPQDLKDGELVLDSLQPGRHTIRVSGHSGNAEFTYDVSEKTAPEIVGDPSASNAMAVLVSTQDDKAHLVTNAENSDVLLDGNAAGHVGPGGLTINQIAKTDHDLEVTQGRDRQRFILTYTPAPALTVYVKSDPNAGTVVLVTHQDNTQVFINDVLYRRRTWQGQLRIPLKVGEYTIRVHKPGFIDPPPETVHVKKAEEAAVQFSLQPVPQIATLAIHGALPGTMVYVDKDLAAVIGSDGSASMSNVKPGERTVELRRGQALPKRFQQTFHAGDVITLSGPDVVLSKAVVDNMPAAPAPAPNPGSVGEAPNDSMEMQGEQVRKGGGFVAYHVPKISGHYSFLAQARKGGFLKHAKLQWYAGYRDGGDFILFTLDGKHATVREVRGGRAFDVARIPFSAAANQWVQVYMQVKPNAIDARVKTPNSAWVDLGGPAADAGQDFTKGKVGFYIPGSDEVAVSNFRFSNQ